MGPNESTHDGRSDSRTRDADGLLPAQRGWLETLTKVGGDWNTACKVRGLKRDRVSGWMRADPAFRAAYQNIMSGAEEVARLRISSLAENAVEAADDLLREEKPYPVQVTCPKCQHSFKKTISIRDASIRRSMVDTILRATGILKDTTRHEVAGEIIHLSMGESIALAQLRRGDKNSVSVPLMMRLQELNLVTPDGDVKQLPEGDVVEGESKPI